MPIRTLTGALLVGVLAAVPALADAGQQGRSRGDRRGARTEDRRGPEAQRAVPRSPEARRSHVGPRQSDTRQRDTRRPGGVGRAQPRPYVHANRGYAGRGYVNPGYRGYVDRGYRGYVNRGYRGAYGRTVIVPRYVRPYVVRIAPYRPYYYRPSIGFGTYYGAGGAYPYGYIPRGYYNPVPGRIYGGVRIIDAPRDARVFADGYYVGIVDDFDGVFQHVNLEAGEHRIEIQSPGFEPIAFDIVVQPGRTITLRADPY